MIVTIDSFEKYRAFIQDISRDRSFVTHISHMTPIIFTVHCTGRTNPRLPLWQTGPCRACWSGPGCPSGNMRFPCWQRRSDETGGTG